MLSMQQKSDRGVSKTGLLLIGVTGGTAVALLAVTAPFLAPALRKICLPYIPATNEQVCNILKVLENRTGPLVDLGSGDGRIVIAAAVNRRMVSTGVELNPWLTWYSRWKAWNAGVSSLTSFVTKDLWKTKLNTFNSIVVFGVEEMMQGLEKKLSSELSENGCVIACRFSLPTWKPVSVYGTGINKVWVYERPKKIN